MRIVRANRMERRLNRLDGVPASVNFATETATVDYAPDAAGTDKLLGAVEAAGYRATLPDAKLAPASLLGGGADDGDETAALGAA